MIDVEPKHWQPQTEAKPVLPTAVSSTITNRSFSALLNCSQVRARLGPGQVRSDSRVVHFPVPSHHYVSF